MTERIPVRAAIPNPREALANAGFVVCLSVIKFLTWKLAAEKKSFMLVPAFEKNDPTAFWGPGLVYCWGVSRSKKKSH